MLKWLALMILIFAFPALAEDEPNCKDPADQATMAQCAGLDADRAEKALNDLWPQQKAEAEANDKDSGKTEYADALLTSQRAWLAFRDAECTWQAFQAHGGSMEPMVFQICKARLTKERIKQLQVGPSE